MKLILKPCVFLFVFVSISLPALANPEPFQSDDTIGDRIELISERHPAYAETLRRFFERLASPSEGFPNLAEQSRYRDYLSVYWNTPEDFLARVRVLRSVIERVMRDDRHSEEYLGSLIGLYFEFIRAHFDLFSAEALGSANHQQGQTFGLTTKELVNDVFSLFFLEEDFSVDIDSTDGALFEPPLFHSGRAREALLPVFVDALHSAPTAEDYERIARPEIPQTKKWVAFITFAVRTSLPSFVRLGPSLETARRVFKTLFGSQGAAREDYSAVREELILSLKLSPKPQHHRMAEMISAFDLDSEDLYYLSLLLSKTSFSSVEEALNFYDEEVVPYFEKNANGLPEESLALLMLHWLGSADRFFGAELGTVEAQRALSIPNHVVRSWEMGRRERSAIDYFSDFTQDPGDLFPEFRAAGLTRTYDLLAREGLDAAESAVELILYSKFHIIPTTEFVEQKMRLLIEYAPKFVQFSSGEKNETQLWAQYLTAIPGVQESVIIKAFLESESHDHLNELIRFAFVMRSLEQTEDVSDNADRNRRVKANLLRLGQELILEKFAVGYTVSSDAQKLEIEEKVLSLLPPKLARRVKFNERRGQYQFKRSFCSKALAAGKSLLRIPARPGRVPFKL